MLFSFVQSSPSFVSSFVVVLELSVAFVCVISSQLSPTAVILYGVEGAVGVVGTDVIV